MIEYNKKMESMLDNILEQTSIIKNDFELNKEVHYNYILEKLKRAEWDLRVIINLAEGIKEKENGK